MSPEQKEIRAEFDEMIRVELSRVCEPHELDNFHDWLTEESPYEQYHRSTWVNTYTGALYSTETIYRFFKNAFYL